MAEGAAGEGGGPGAVWARRGACASGNRAEGEVQVATAAHCPLPTARPWPGRSALCPARLATGLLERDPACPVPAPQWASVRPTRSHTQDGPTVRSRGEGKRTGGTERAQGAAPGSGRLCPLAPPGPGEPRVGELWKAVGRVTGRPGVGRAALSAPQIPAFESLSFPNPKTQRGAARLHRGRGARDVLLPRGKGRR